MFSRVLVATTLALAATRGANAEAQCSASCKDNKLLISANEIVIENDNGKVGFRANTNMLREDIDTAHTTLHEELKNVKSDLIAEIKTNISNTEKSVDKRVAALFKTLNEEKDSLDSLRSELVDHMICSEESKIYVGRFPNGTCEYPKVPVCGGLDLADPNRVREGGSCVGIYASECKTMCKSGFVGGEELTFECTDNTAEDKNETFHEALAQDAIAGEFSKLHKMQYGDHVYIVDQAGAKTWQEAQDFCADNNGTLVEFWDSVQFRTVMQFAMGRTDGGVDGYTGMSDNEFWIGLNGGDSCAKTWDWGFAPDMESLGSEADGIDHWMYWANPQGQKTVANQGDKWISSVHPPHDTSQCCATAKTLPDTGNDGFHNVACTQEKEIKFICQAKRNMDIEAHSGTGWQIQDGKSGLLADNQCVEIDECSSNFTDGSFAKTPGFVPGMFQKLDVNGSVIVDGLACPTTTDASGQDVFKCYNSVGSFECMCRDNGGVMTYAIGNDCMLPTVMEEADMKAVFDSDDFVYGGDVAYDATKPVTTDGNTYSAFNVKRGGEDLLDGVDTFINDPEGGGLYQAEDNMEGGVEIHFADPYMLTAFAVFCVKADADAVTSGECFDGGLFDFGDIEVQYWDVYQKKFITTSSLKAFNVGNWDSEYNPAHMGGPQPVLFKESPASKIWRFVFANTGNNCAGADCTAPSAHRSPAAVRISDIKIVSAVKYVSAF
jgi:hypothetical protein